MSKTREDDKYEWQFGHDDEMKEIILVIKSTQVIKPEEFVQLVKDFYIYAEMNVHDLWSGRKELEVDTKLN